MRTIWVLLIVLIPLSSMAQSPDSVYITKDATIYEKNSLSSEELGEVNESDKVPVLDASRTYYKIKTIAQEGWVKKTYTEPLAERQARRREARDLRQRLQAKGYTLVLVSESFNRSSTGSIDVGLGLINISESKTIKYATATWQLFNPVGDPVEKDVRSSTAETRFVGPLGPGEAGQSTFENVWRSNVGTCAELKKLVVEHIDGTSFTYVNDLQYIAQISETVRLEGDCSYEAQQSRE